MLVAQQLGESANELVAGWPNGQYRYGFPDFYAAEFPVRPMAYDKSRIYQGVIGRHYPYAQTERYHYMYDPNMYLQPGFGADAATVPGTLPAPQLSRGTKIAIVGGVLAVSALSVFAAFRFTRG